MERFNRGAVFAAGPTAERSEGAGLSWRAWEAALLRLAAAGFVAFNLGKHGLYRPLTIHGVDYPKHWLAARAVLEGRSVYAGDQLWMGFNYPQWSALLTFWLGWLPLEAAEHLWKLTMLGALAGAWWLAWREFRPQPEVGEAAQAARGGLRRTVSRELARHWGLTAAVLIVAFSPAGASGLFAGNVQPFNVFLVMAFVAALLAGREALAGVYWAMLCLVKMTPLALAAPILIWRRGSVLAGWGGFIGLYGVVLALTGRWREEAYFFGEVAAEVPFYWREISKSVPRGLLLWLSPRRWHESPELFNRAIALYVVGLALLLTGALLALRARRVPFLCALEPSLVVVPLFSPLLEGHHFGWALPALFLQVRRWATGEMSGATAAALAIGWVAVSLDYFYSNMLQSWGAWTHFLVTLGGAWLLAASALSAFKSAPATA